MKTRKGKTKEPAADKGQEKRQKAELDKQICYSYARSRNASRVAKEFGVNHVYVLRAWKRLTDDEREALLDTKEAVDEELNRKIITAERAAGDTFIARMVEARERLSEELVRRCTGARITIMSNKDLTSMLRLVATVTAPDGADVTEEDDDPLAKYRNTIREQIDDQTKR